MVVQLSVAVMHHPARPECLDRLVADLRAMGVEPDVVVDPEPFAETNPWRCAREAWRRAPDDCTHRLVIQDDALVCDDFPAAAAAAIAAQPDHPISFFVNWLGHQLGRAQMQACDRCDAWAWLPPNGWYPTVATALPLRQARDLAGWKVERHVIADDAAMGQWAMKRGVRFLQTVPSLVQHDEDAPSTISGHNTRSRGRGAVCFIGDEDWRLIDWSRGPR